jgi:O-methyltransferase involved in polyketide biosynthesis
MTGAQTPLTAEQETLFIPLYSKAVESRRRDPILHDPKAEAILAQVGYDFARLHVPARSRITLAMRARRLDELVQAFTGRHDTSVVLHLGCGLDSRVLRVGVGKARWYDVDFPEVITVRRAFYEEHDGYRMLGSSLAELGWIEQLPTGLPAIIIAEGVLMYLHEPEVRALLQALQARFPTGELAFDAFSSATLRRIQRHPSLRQTGAQVVWGLDDPGVIVRWLPGARLVEEWSFTQSPDIIRLGLGYRLAFRLAHQFSVARRAHRILRYRW